MIALPFSSVMLLPTTFPSLSVTFTIPPTIGWPVVASVTVTLSVTFWYVSFRTSTSMFAFLPTISASVNAGAVMPSSVVVLLG